MAVTVKRTYTQVIVPLHLTIGGTLKLVSNDYSSNSEKDLRVALSDVFKKGTYTFTKATLILTSDDRFIPQILGKMTMNGSTITENTIISTPEEYAVNLGSKINESCEFTFPSIPCFALIGKISKDLESISYGTSYTMLNPELYSVGGYHNYDTAVSSPVTIYYGDDEVLYSGEMETPFAVIYNGVQIATVNSGETKMLHTSGKIARSNIVVGNRMINCAGKRLEVPIGVVAQ